MMHDALYTLAVDLLEGLEPDACGRPAACAVLPGGKVATLTVFDDPDSGIGAWRGGQHHDDVFGTFAWRGRDRCTGLPCERPAGFDGAARVIHGDSRGAFGDSVWWQPPAGLTSDQVDQMHDSIMEYHHGEWRHVGLSATVYRSRAALDIGSEDGTSTLWGVEFGCADGTRPSDHADVLADLLSECGLDGAALDLVARFPDLATMHVC